MLHSRRDKGEGQQASKLDAPAAGIEMSTNIVIDDHGHHTTRPTLDVGHERLVRDERHLLHAVAENIQTSHQTRKDTPAPMQNTELEVYMTPQMKHRVYVGETHEEAASRKASVLSDPSRGQETSLSRMTAACYSVGHFLNDATASCWFSYLLLYLEQAQGLNGIEAGIVLFSGQLFDAIATPIVGLLSDRSKGIPLLGLGRRKAWNFGGVLVVILCFFFVFGFCIPCAFSNNPTTLDKTIAFSVFASLFNVGWASVQVSHMCMVPELTHDESERVMLNSARYAFTVLANVYVFIAMWVILHVYNDGNEDNKYDPHVYSLLTYSVILFGGLLSVMFLVGTKEQVAVSAPDKYQPLVDADEAGSTASKKARGRRNSETNAQVKTDTTALLEDFKTQAKMEVKPECATVASIGLGGQRPTVMTWRDWLRMWDFYKVAVVYMFTRLATNVSQVYLTFFVTVTLNMDQTAIAIVPLLVYISSLIATIAMKRIDRRLGRRNTMTLGAIFFAAACTIMIFLESSAATLVYPSVLLLGVGSAITMVVSVSLEADLVGRNVESAAFLYGAISLTDKLSNGIAILGIQYVGNGINDDASRRTFIRYVNALIPAVAMGCAAVVAWTIKFPKHLRGSPGNASINQSSSNQERPPSAAQRLSRFFHSERSLVTAAEGDANDHNSFLLQDEQQSESSAALRAS
jgi:Na+/melibiose symporter-like transporter